MVIRTGNVARLLGCAALAAACEPLIGADFGPYEVGAATTTTGSGASAGSHQGGAGGAGGGGSCAAVENCATPEDDDCNGEFNLECGAWVESWLVEQTADALPQELMSGMIPTSNGALTVGSFHGQLTLGGLDSLGTYAALITRVQPGVGSASIVRSLLRSGTAYFSDVAALPSGGYVVGGGYSGSATTADPFDAALPNVSGLAAMVARFDQSDTYVDSALGPGGNEELVTAIAAGPNGQVAAIGFTAEDLPSFDVDVTSTNRQFFLTRLDGALSPTWSTVFSSDGSANTCGAGDEYQSETSLRVAFGSQGELWATGMFCGSIVTDSKTLLGQRDLFVLRKGAADGGLQGLSGGDGQAGVYQVGRAIVPTSDGGALLAGDFEGQLPLGDSMLLESYGGRDLFVAKLSASLVVEWARNYGSVSDETARDLALAPDGTMYLAGHFTGYTDIGYGQVGAGDGVERAFWLRLDADGDPIHSHVYGDAYMGASTHGARRIALGADGRVWLAGLIGGELAFDPTPAGTLRAALPSGFIAHFDP